MGSNQIVKDHLRLQTNLKLLQRIYSVTEISEALGISISTWTNRMKEPWRKFSYDDFRVIAKFCNVDFVQLIDGTLSIS